jgi:hypothetical protein
LRSVEEYPTDMPYSLPTFIISTAEEVNTTAAGHIARHDPARVLREVAAKRAILTAVEKYLDPHPGQPCTNEDDQYDSCDLHTAATGRVSPDVLPLLASVWSDHPDCRAEWSTA